MLFKGPNNKTMLHWNGHKIFNKVSLFDYQNKQKINLIKALSGEKVCYKRLLKTQFFHIKTIELTLFLPFKVNLSHEKPIIL